MGKTLAILLVLLAGGNGMATTAADQQADLDRLCEEARDRKLAPIRVKIFDECLEKKQGDKAYCQRYADGYNGNRIGGAPRFYELPECEAAFKYRNRRRS